VLVALSIWPTKWVRFAKITFFRVVSTLSPRPITGSNIRRFFENLSGIAQMAKPKARLVVAGFLALWERTEVRVAPIAKTPFFPCQRTSPRVPACPVEASERRRVAPYRPEIAATVFLYTLQVNGTSDSIGTS
jgi:hypothetical protein